MKAGIVIRNVDLIDLSLLARQTIRMFILPAQSIVLEKRRNECGRETISVAGIVFQSPTWHLGRGSCHNLSPSSRSGTRSSRAAAALPAFF